MRKHWSTILLVFLFVIGLSLLMYPAFADWWNSMHQSRAIASYSEAVANIDEDQYDEIWNAAWEYNRSVLERGNRFRLTEEQKQTYDGLLNITDSGIMGYIEIPDIDVSLPIYHGTGEAVLQVAAGHLEWTSLPVGGAGSHCVISGHRGLPSAKLFTDLDRMALGDTFTLRILDEVLTYEVDQILIVEPQDTEALMIEEGKDLCTLVTCTPYGINSHRMLVRGHRTENAEEAGMIRVTADAMQMDPIIVAPMVAAPMLLVLLVIMLFNTRKKRNDSGQEGFPW